MAPSFPLDDNHFSGAKNITNGALVEVLNALSSGGGSSTVGAPTDGDFGTSGGVSGLAAADLVADALDKMESILEKLVPPVPAGLSTKTITIASTYQAREETSGTLRTTVIDDQTPTASVDSEFYDGDTGILNAEVDAAIDGAIVLSTANDSGTNQSLNISSDVDPFLGVAGKEGFYKVLDASITAAVALALGGPHTYQLKHSTTGDSNLLSFHIDDPATPSVTGQALAADGGTGLGFVSGVPTMETGDTTTVTFNAVNCVSEFYNATRISRAESAYTTDVNDALPGTPPAKGVTVPASVQVAVETNKYNEDLPITCRAYNSKNVSNTAIATNGIRVDTLSNETIRVKSGSGALPDIGSGAGEAGDAYDSTESLNSNEELQLVGGRFEYPNGNYTTNVPVAGPNYSAISNTRWATFKFTGYSDKSGTITINGASGFSSILESNLLLQVKVDGATGWVDVNAAYPGVGDPVNDDDPALVVGSSSATVKEFTFGTTVHTGDLYVRIGLPLAGNTKSFTTLSLT